MTSSTSASTRPTTAIWNVPRLEPRQPPNRATRGRGLKNCEPEKRPASGNQPTDDDAQGERGPGTARPPERTGTRDETSRPAPRKKGVALRRRLSRRRGSSAAEAQDAMPTRPMGGEIQTVCVLVDDLLSVRPTSIRGREGELSLKRASRRSRVATLRGKAAGVSVDTKDPQHHKEHETEQRGEKHVQEPPRKRVSDRSRASEASTRAPEDINRLLEQAVAEVRQERGLLDGMAFDLGDLFRHVSQSQSVFTVTKIDILRFLDSLGLVPESQLEQAFENLEAEKQDPLAVVDA